MTTAEFDDLHTAGGSRNALSRRRMLWIAAVGSSPFLAGALLCRLSDGQGAAALFCPFRGVTGLPCPLCGASRAFMAVGVGSPDVLRYNAGVVAVAAAVLCVGLLGLARPRVGRRVSALSGRAIAWLVLAAVAFSWAWALANRGTIVT